MAGYDVDIARLRKASGELGGYSGALGEVCGDATAPPVAGVTGAIHPPDDGGFNDRYTRFAAAFAEEMRARGRQVGGAAEGLERCADNYQAAEGCSTTGYEHAGGEPSKEYAAP